MTQVITIVLIILALSILLLGNLCGISKHSLYYKALIILLNFTCSYIIIYGFQILTNTLEIGRILFILKKSLFPFIISSSVLFIFVAVGKEVYYQRTKLFLTLFSLIQALMFYIIPLETQNNVWKFELYSKINVPILITAAFLGISLLCSLYLILNAFITKTTTLKLSEIIFIFLLQLPTYAYYVLSLKFGSPIDIYGITGMVTCSYIFIKILMKNQYILYPIIKNSTFDLINDPVVITDKNYKLRDYNEAVTKLFSEVDFKNSYGSDITKVLKEFPAVAHSLNTLKNEIFEYNNHFYNVEPVLMQNNNQDTPTIYSLVFKDNTEYISSLKKLRENTVVDYLTQLKNSQFFKEMLTLEISKNNRYNLPFLVFYIDIDNFSKVNEKYGHIAGDTVIIQMAQLLSNEVRHSDLVSRFQEDSFLILLSNTEEQYANLIANRLKTKVETTNFKFNNTPIFTTISIGIVKSEQDFSKSINYYLDTAVKNCKEAKLNGKNGIAYKF